MTFQEMENKLYKLSEAKEMEAKQLEYAQSMMSRADDGITYLERKGFISSYEADFARARVLAEAQVIYDKYDLVSPSEDPSASVDEDKTMVEGVAHKEPETMPKFTRQ